MPRIEIEHIIRVSPEIECTVQCPHDGTVLEAIQVIIPGMRCLVETVCPACGNKFYADLPVGQALLSPMIIDQESGQVYDAVQHIHPVSFGWFRKLLREGFLNPVHDEIVPIVHTFRKSDRIILLNCLDFLYGHSLLKLLNVQRYLDHTPELGCCVLVPTQLRHLVPDGVAEIWEIPIPIKAGRKWYWSLQMWITEKLTHYTECFLSPAYSHPSNNIYDLCRFVRDLPDISESIICRRPVIMFSYREDRLWGKTLSHQQRNIRALYQQLMAIFPDLVFVMVGFGKKPGILPPEVHVVDLTIDRFDIERERLWMAYMSIADCAVGIHGSNMLLPSGLAQSTVELIPRSRLRNTVQDFLFQPMLREPRDALLHYRMLYGNETLSNIQPSMVTDVIANVVSYSILNSKWFRCGEKGTPEFIEWHTIYEDTVFRQATEHLGSVPKKSLLQKTSTYIVDLLDSVSSGKIFSIRGIS